MTFRLGSYTWFDVYYKGEVVNKDYDLSRALMGKEMVGGHLRCFDILYNKHLAYIRFGFNDDIIVALAFEYNAQDELTGIWRHIWARRDGAIVRTIDKSGALLMKHGRNGDLYAVLRFDFNTKQWYTSLRSYKAYPEANTPVRTHQIYPK
ncbi:MAG: hypothetical protein AAF502_21830 [Bacteroidota bacterium]